MPAAYQERVMMLHRVDARVLAVLVGLMLVGLIGGGAALSPSLAQGQAGVGKRVDVLIGFIHAPGPQDRRLVESVGGQINREFRIVPAVAASVPEAAIAGLSRNPRVQAIEPDGQFHLIGLALDHTAPPDISDAQAQAELDKVWGVRRIGAGAVHSAGNNRGAAVRVAVLDSGIDHVGHAQEFPDYIYAGGWDFVNNDDDPRDDNGHGTHVTGTVAAARNGAGVVGVAPEVELYALKVLGANGSGSFSNVIAALQWCVDHGIHVTNHSYGSSQNPGTIVQAAFDNAYAAGVLHVAAAGNSGNPRGSGNNVGYPARYGSVVAVAATTTSDARASFSSTGPDVELAAPGQTIHSTTMGGGFGNMSGTSMASPHVAGVAALVMHTLGQINQAAFDDGQISAAQLQAAQISLHTTTREILAFSAEDLGTAGHDPHFGFGLVDAVTAVTLAAAVPPCGDEGDDDGGDNDPPPTQDVVRIQAITYATTGPPPQPSRDLLITVTVQDGAGQALANADISITVNLNGDAYATGSATTDGTGQVTFRIQKAPGGTWTTTVSAVQAAGHVWDGVTPENGFVKN
jgi:subtilisin